MVEENAHAKIKINYRHASTKYFLMTNGSGYPSAEFLNPPFSQSDGYIIIQEILDDTSDISRIIIKEPDGQRPPS